MDKIVPNAVRLILQSDVNSRELPNWISLLASKAEGLISHELHLWENVIFSLMVVGGLSVLGYRASRRLSLIPGPLQNAIEILVAGVDDFVCGILGERGKKYTPFIGTLFIYILCMNWLGLIPLMKSSTTSWSTTLALALCVFGYVQYTAFKELGFRGYLDHLMGRPRGGLAFSMIIPLLMFFLHFLTELIRPLSLSLRLRSNIWGEDLLLAVLAKQGILSFPLLFFNTLLALIASTVQAVVFCLLSTIYFSLILGHEE